MAVLGTLEYLISIDSSKISSGLNSAEGKVKGFGNRLSAWTVAKGQMLGGLITKAGQATMRFVGGAVQESQTFDKSMSQVAATLGKSTKEIQNLTDFAREMGSKTAFTANEAAQGLNYMALAGYDASTSMKMLPSVLNLAAAGNFDLARASDMVTDAQSALGLTVEETEIMVDQMAKTSSKTNTSVEQLGEAFLTVGGTAKKLKGGTAELSALLGVLANNGIKGAEGGTALRNVLNGLSNPAGKAAKQLKRLKIDAYDKEGNLRSMTDVLSEFREKTDKMTTKQRTDLFAKMFNVRDLKSVEALLSMTSDDWAKLTKEIEDSNGAADKMAKTQLDNLAGDMTLFDSALSEAKLTIVEGLTPTLRNFAKIGTQWLTDFSKGFKEKGLAGAIDASRKAFDTMVRKMRRSENPVVRFLAQSVLAFKRGFTWNTFRDVVTKGWDLIREGFGNLGKLIFGENADGTTKWPTWETVGAVVSGAWEGIKNGFKTLSKLIFGENADGTTKWPTWETVSTFVSGAWDGIKEGFSNLGKLVFGENADGTTNWPTWDTVKDTVTKAWEKICEEAGKLKGFVLGDTGSAADVFTTLLTNFTNLKETIEQGAIDIGTWFFGEENSATVVAAVKEISDAIVAIGTAVLAIEVTKGITDFIALFQQGGAFAQIFGSGGTLATFLTTNKVGLIVGGIALALVEIIEHWDQIEPALKEFGGWINQYVLEPIKQVGEWIDTNIIQPIKNIIAEFKKTFGLDLPEPVASGENGELTQNSANDLLWELGENGNPEKNGRLFRDDAGNGWRDGGFIDSMKKSMEDAGYSADQVADAVEAVSQKLKEGDVQWVKDFVASMTDAQSQCDMIKEALGELTSEDWEIKVKLKQEGEESETKGTPVYKDRRRTPTLPGHEEGANAVEQQQQLQQELAQTGSAGTSAGTSVKSGMNEAQSATSKVREQLELAAAALESLKGEHDIKLNLITGGGGGLLDGGDNSNIIAPGNAKGVPTVPYDDYLTRLHRGEMVLTKSQARQYREGGSGGGVDISAMAASIVAAVREGMAGASVNSYLDGKGVTDNVNRRTSNKLRARRFSMA